MAVVPMQKVQLLVHQSDADAALDVIQRLGAVEFQAKETTEETTLQTQFVHAGLLPRVEHTVSFLTPYEKKLGVFASLREGSQVELTEDRVAKTLADTEAVAAVVRDVEALQVELAEKTNTVRILEEKHSWLHRWQALPFKLSALETKSTITRLAAIDQAVQPEMSLAAQLEASLSDSQILYALTDVSPSLVAITLPKTAPLSEVTNALETVGAEWTEYTEGTQTPEVELTAVAEALAAAKGQVALAHDQAEFFAKEHLQRLRVTTEILNWAKERHTALDHATATDRTVLFTGWLDATKREEIEATFTTQKLAATLYEVEPADDEQPPVEIRNNSFIAPFEAVTRLYGMPGYKDLDPTMFLAGFFFLFFGLSLTDVGYGLSLVAISAFLLFACKLSKPMRSIAKLLFYIGIATVLVGALFGGYLGIDPSLLPAPLQAIQLFDPIGNPLPVFYLALSLGVLQVMVGMILMIYSEAKNGRLIDGLFDQGPWLFMFSLGIMYVGVATEYVSFLSVPQIQNLALVGVALILIAGARKPGTIVQKIITSLAGLYAGVGYFSDVLSYSRLLALGLATSALAFAVNLIAAMVIEIPYVGIVLAAAIWLLGHVFTLIINTLGAFVHSARLQFVEFFGKFIAGTGKDFSPLRRSEEYVTIRDD